MSPPPTPVQGGLQSLQRPPESLAARTGPRSFSTSQPVLPTNANWNEIAGPAPGPKTIGSSFQFGSSADDDQIRHVVACGSSPAATTYTVPREIARSKTFEKGVWIRDQCAPPSLVDQMTVPRLGA